MTRADGGGLRAELTASDTIALKVKLQRRHWAAAAVADARRGFDPASYQTHCASQDKASKSEAKVSTEPVRADRLPPVWLQAKTRKSC